MYKHLSASLLGFACLLLFLHWLIPLVVPDLNKVLAGTSFAARLCIYGIQYGLIRVFYECTETRILTMYRMLRYHRLFYYLYFSLRLLGCLYFLWYSTEQLTFVYPGLWVELVMLTVLYWLMMGIVFPVRLFTIL